MDETKLGTREAIEARLSFWGLWALYMYAHAPLRKYIGNYEKSQEIHFLED